MVGVGGSSPLGRTKATFSLLPLFCIFPEHFQFLSKSDLNYPFTILLSFESLRRHPFVFF